MNNVPSRGRKKGSLLMCSIGLKPGHITVRTLSALLKCDSVHMSAAEPGLLEMLKRKGVKVVMMPAMEGHAVRVDRHADAIIEDAVSGRRTALLTYGHPVFLSAMWDNLLPKLRAKRIKFTIEEGVSSLDCLLRRAGIRSIPPEGIAILSAISIISGASARLPESGFFLFDAGALKAPARERRAERFFADLISRYDREHLCLALEVPCFQEPEGATLEFRLKDYRRALRGFNNRTTLYIPPDTR